MSRLRRNFAKLNSLFRNNRVEEELAREVTSHLTLLSDDFERRGMSPEEAQLAAKRAYGGVEQAKQAHRDERSLLWIEHAIQDLRYALRMLGRSPGFAAVAILTLALGIGANSAIFSVINAVLLRALPGEDSQRLVVLSWNSHQEPKLNGHSKYGDCDDDNHTRDCAFSVPFYKALRSHTTTFSGLAAFAGPFEVGFSGNGAANIARGEYVSGDYFSTVGVKTVEGRPLSPADDAPSASPAIVLDYGYWQRAFGADPSAVGRTIRLNNVDVAIVGVAERSFTSLTPGKSQDFFMPLSLAMRVQGEQWRTQDRLSDPASWWVVLVGRLKPGVSLEQAQAETTTLFHIEVLHSAKPIFSAGDTPSLRLLPAREALNGASSEIAPMLELIMAAVGFILLIACANVAGLILARSANRQKELAMRQALGAGRARIVRQLLTEGLVLAITGGGLGILVAVWGVHALTSLISSGLNSPFPFVIALDWRVLAFTSCAALATGVVCGLVPSFLSVRADLTPSIRETAPSTSGGASQGGWRFRSGDALVVAQVALSVVVLVGAGLLVRTLHKLQTLDPGFDTQNVLLFGINPSLAGYKDRQTVDLYRQLQERFEAVPGVMSASYSEDALLSGSWSASDVHLDGAPPKTNANTATLRVGPDFFRTMQIPIIAGRLFTPADFASAEATNGVIKAAKQVVASDSPKAANPTGEPQTAPEPILINQAFARKYFPNQNSIGLHVGNRQGDEPSTGPQPGYLIVGIVGNTKYSRLRREIMPTMFLPLVGNSAHFELRTSGDPVALVKQVRAIVAQADNNLPLFDVRTQSQQIEQALYQERLMSRLSSFFAFLALILACIGLYGLLSYEVARRTREMGIRMALGAQRGALMRLVVRRGLLLAMAGAVIGTGAALAVTRLMSAILYDVRPYDPATLAGVCILLVMVALVACLVPARRAMSIDPMVALRNE
ncbi:ABC transporter permease [Terriglobus roseus]|uniref:Duplicated orphan permease n=1 Tax=Terriglobus roseus TaxID=392734 RepID=A0A1G7NP13_9BACT|nr:ABC transporter permease [Terriglobus roseus]SDF75794.1 duplicated orphan permease [Terriglobus roseus]